MEPPRVPQSVVRVLLVEDGQAEAAEVGGILARADGAVFDLDVVRTLDDALDRMEGHAPDVVLLDLTLPDSSGLDTFLSLRDRTPDVPVVVVTGDEELGLGRAAVEAGAQDYLVKGKVEHRRLVEALVYAVDRQRGARPRALHDPLTGLATPELLADRIRQLLENLPHDRFAAVVVVGLDGLRALDATLGRGAGNEVVSRVARRLTDALPPSATIARIGSADFAAAVGGLVRPANAERAGARVLGTLVPEFVLPGGHARVLVSVGVALGRYPGDADRMLEGARSAMTEVRRTGGQRVLFRA